MLKRICRHLTTTASAGRRAFPAAGMQAIQAAIEDGERLHRAEIRLMVEPSMSLGDLIDKRSSRERACELFSEYGIWDTEENSGILVYINLADHQVEIIADRGVNRLLEASQWQQVCRIITNGFAHGRYHESVLDAIGQLNAMLHKVLPARDGDHNPDELPNKPLLL